jgi:AIPR protein
VGNETLSDWYADSLSPILVDEQFNVVVKDGFEIQADQWSAFVTALPASFLYRLYKKHKTKLFSANVRDYLGSRKTDQNINYGIKQTAEQSPDNFWVFNNGLTMLVNEFRFPGRKDGGARLTIRGLSIVNGAQTTGAIGSLKKLPDPSAFVPVRLIKTANRDVIYDVIRYNNSQNKVTAPDFRSTDRVQKRLKEEMTRVPNAEYEGGRRGGHEDIIRRRANLLPSNTVGQAAGCVPRRCCDRIQREIQHLDFR